MSRLVVVLSVLAVIAVGFSLQAVIVLLRRHTVDARRPGPLIERRRRVATGGPLPPRLDALELMTTDTLGGTPVAIHAMWEHLTDLAAHAPRDVEIAPPGRVRQRARWLHDQLDRLEAAYREQ